MVDENYEIVAGHTRYKALQQLGIDRAPCVILSDVPPEKIREYRIADNKVAEIAEWDMASLIPELRALADPSAMQQFFEDVNLSDLLAETAGAGFKPPDQGAIERLQTKMDGRFEQDSKDRQADYIDFPCPHCGETFALSLYELRQQVKIRDEAAKAV